MIVISNYEEIDFRAINERNRELLLATLKRNHHDLMLLAEGEITEDTDLSELPEFVYKGVSDKCYLIGFFISAFEIHVSFYDSYSPYGTPETIRIDDAFGGLDSEREYDAVTWFFDKWNTSHARTKIRKEGAFSERDMVLIGDSCEETIESGENDCTMLVSLSNHAASKLVHVLNEMNGYDAWSIVTDKT